MDPIDLFRKLFLYAITLTQTIGTGSLGDAYHLTLQSWYAFDSERRGEFYYAVRQQFEAPAFAIVSVSRGNFRRTHEYGMVNSDGSTEITYTEEDHDPFEITCASRESWSCLVPGKDGPLTQKRRIRDFSLLLVATQQKPSRTLGSLGGWTRVHIRFPDSIPALSPCTSEPDLTGQNVLGFGKPSTPRTEALFIQPAPIPSSSTLPTTARRIIRPQRVNWIYWDATRGFGPRIFFEAYTQYKTSEF